MKRINPDYTLSIKCRQVFDLMHYLQNNILQKSNIQFFQLKRILEQC